MHVQRKGDDMKSVLISIQPKWCELIASGKKTVEVRKTRPKLETPFKCYIYATKPRHYFKISEHLAATDENLFLSNGTVKMSDGFEHWADGIKVEYLNGKVIGEFVCDQIDEIGYSPEMHGKYICDIDDIHYVSCVNFEQMFDYLADGYGYAWHISDLVIYDEPRELSGFYHYCGDDPECDGCEAHYFSNTECGKEDYCCSVMYGCKPLKRPPQSWCYVEGE